MLMLECPSLTLRIFPGKFPVLSLQTLSDVAVIRAVVLVGGSRAIFLPPVGKLFRDAAVASTRVKRVIPAPHERDASLGSKDPIESDAIAPYVGSVGWGNELEVQALVRVPVDGPASSKNGFGMIA